MTTCRREPLHYIPGYTGYSPQYTYRSSDSYGTLIQKNLVDFNKKHLEKIYLSTRADDEYKIERPILTEIDIAKEHEISKESHRTLSGFQGYIPFLGEKISLRYGILVDDNIPAIDKQILEDKRKSKYIKYRSAILDNGNPHKSLGERSFKGNDYRYSLSALRPDVESTENDDNIKDLPEPPPLPYSKESYFNISNTNNHISDPLPFKWPKFGEGNKAYENGIICDFVNNYHHRRKIYSKHRGIIPNYTGHVPGQKFSIGKTYGASTIDAKKFLNA
ncbi:UPF0605 protein CG18335-like [Condylostylus longicornis]|uniref:UPF0605 protein CG18335-like n=1 Tax=Condylostylus longicornis TaxID=2530218 RepID=UPI00244E0CA8|nr:UPF0605 protein CG18335-like [Condylostylus longicornis]